MKREWPPSLQFEKGKGRRAGECMNLIQQVPVAWKVSPVLCLRNWPLSAMSYAESPWLRRSECRLGYVDHYLIRLTSSQAAQNLKIWAPKGYRKSLVHLIFSFAFKNVPKTTAPTFKLKTQQSVKITSILCIATKQVKCDSSNSRLLFVNTKLWCISPVQKTVAIYWPPRWSGGPTYSKYPDFIQPKQA